MLEYRRTCERCGREVASGDPQVYICSFECTWCAACAAAFPLSACPNCGGMLAPRPVQSRQLSVAHRPPHPHSDGQRSLARTA